MVIKNGKFKKERQYIGQKKGNKRTNNDLQNTTHKTNNRVTRTPLEHGGEVRYCGRVINPCSTCSTHRVTFVTNPMIIHEIL